jgi:2-polyprenyl-3-methyl-5-hydroxy-6-metoxy-1,4-benzoquinol methylase
LASKLIDSSLNVVSPISGEPTETILDLGMHSFADTFIPTDKWQCSEPILPLVCQLDRQSGLIQLKYVSDPQDRYGLYAYSYTSSNSSVSRNHWDSFADSTNEIFPLLGKSVLEIGSNDGYLLQNMKKHGAIVIGIDASKSMADQSGSEGLNVIHGIFGESEAAMGSLRNFRENYDVIVANNVVNHANDLMAFLGSVASFLSHEGVFIFEVPYWLRTIDSLRFDQIYHEHITYFTIKSVKELLHQHGLTILRAEEVDYHGGSIRITATKQSILSPNNVEIMIQAEYKEGLFNPERYLQYSRDIQKKRMTIMSQVYSLKDSGSTIFGIGAAAKANTFLTYCGLNSTVVDFITDSSPAKVGKKTPLTRIPIALDDELAGIKSPIGIVLAWNLSVYVKDKLNKINPTVRYIQT